MGYISIGPFAMLPEWGRKVRIFLRISRSILTLYTNKRTFQTQIALDNVNNYMSDKLMTNKVDLTSRHNIKTMPLTKSQKSVLKKIDAIFSRFEKFTEKAGISLKDYEFDNEFHFPDIGYLQKKKVNEQSRKRQQVFKQVKQLKSRVH